MASFVLRLSTDILQAGEVLELAACKRAIYVVQGGVVVRSGGVAASLDPNGACCMPGAATVTAGRAGARVLHWELVQQGAAAAGSAAGSLTLAAPLDLPAKEVLMRCDRVEFPPGGEALTHVHQGPGIRCLVAGAIRIDSLGNSHHYGVGQAWFEAGPEPVYAAASATEATAFVRVMILPRTCHGKSSIRYVRPEDADKPKSQKYQVFADEFIDV
ncbi:MAG: hypothetical protein ACKVQQ_13380 [Burkholderiales bacterium]